MSAYRMFEILTDFGVRFCRIYGYTGINQFVSKYFLFATSQNISKKQGYKSFTKTQ